MTNKYHNTLAGKMIYLIILLCFQHTVGFSQAKVLRDSIPQDVLKKMYATPEEVQWFRDAKFAVFMHWGPYSLKKAEASWGRLGPRKGSRQTATEGVPEKEYNALYKKFNPVKFDADQWIKMVKDAGAKYFIFTTKHHDGFCMFDAKNTEFKITNSPFGRDIAKELADACHKHGIKLFWYYSQPDWTHPDCLTENNERYRKYMYEHLRQLLTEYGKVDGIFFDCLGTRYSDWDTPEMVKMIRKLQPGIVINRRWGFGLPKVKVLGDYDNPEQEIGRFEINRPWETCATMGAGWSWRGEGEVIKTSHTSLRMLIQTAGSGGNLALNTGPKPDGTINPPEVENYLYIGKWLKKYGESVYGTIGGPYKPAPWGVSTRTNDKIYLHVLNDFTDKTSKALILKDLPYKVKSAKLLTGKGKVKFSQKGGHLTIQLPSKGLNTSDNIVVLNIKGDATTIEPIEDTSVLKELKVVSCNASSFTSDKNRPEVVFGLVDESFFKAGKRHKVFWSAKNGEKKSWVEFELEKASKVSYISLAERIHSCSATSFVIEYERNGKWQKAYQGTDIGVDFSVRLPEIVTKKLRIKFLENMKGKAPNIQKIKLYTLK